MPPFPRAASTRRDFLRRAGGAAVALGTSGSLAAFVEGCSPSGTSRQAGSTTSVSPTTAAAASAPTTTADASTWAQLASSLDGHLVLPADPSYAVDRLLFDEKFDGIHPAAIAYCATSTDVQRCVDYARSNTVPLAARAGGHSYGGYSLTTGLVIDVTPMAAVAVSEGNQSATIGAGARLIDVYSGLGRSGVLLPGGSCPTVGLAGLTLGGGIGVVGRKYGLACDRLSSVDIVRADGTLVTASAGEHEDLFWACRGGGGGNFGIVTAFTFDVDPIPPIALFTLEWPWAAAADVLGGWSAWLPATPPALWANCQVLSGGTTGSAPLQVKVNGVYCGSVADLDAAVAGLVRAVGSTPTYRYVGAKDYLDAMLIEAGCEGSTVAECHLPSQNPAGKLTRSAFQAKSTYLTSALPDAGIAAVVSATEDLDHSWPALSGGFVFDSYGGQIAQVATDATAFAHRDAQFGIQYLYNWGPTTPASSITGGQSWLAGVQRALAPYVGGAYVNYIDPTLEGWAEAYYGANLPRLRQIKSEVDPDDLFHFAQSIPPA